MKRLYEDGRNNEDNMVRIVHGGQRKKKFGYRKWTTNVVFNESESEDMAQEESPKKKNEYTIDNMLFMRKFAYDS